ncbi:hypothetical protein BH23BAC3_BH23BAC3_18780 [soil metagenome]
MGSVWGSKCIRESAFWLVFMLLVCPTLLYAQSTTTIQRLSEPIQFDGMPDDAAWQSVDPLPLMTYFPEDGREPSERSDVRIAYVDEYLYVGARLYDSEPDRIQSTTYQRNFSGLTSDFFGIVLDNFNSNETGVAFFTAPTGVRSDLRISNDAEGGGALNWDWNTFWDVETVITDEGWFVEMRIPISSLRFQERDGQVRMGLTVMRWIARKNESNIFPAFPNQWGFQGHFKPSQTHPVVFESLEPRRSMYITPYLLGGFGHNHQLADDATDYIREDDLTHEIGLDINTSIRGNLTLDVTLNTDFAQVEADDEQVNLTRFSLFFPEKRQFFQERAELFDFSMGGPNRLFHSRRIGIHQGEQVRILGGARLTGSVGDWDLGFLNMQTARERGIPSENFGTLRLKRRVLNPNSFVGAIFTSRISEEGTYNYAHGLDATLNLFGDDFLTLNYGHTFETHGNQSLSNMDATRLRFDWTTRRIVGFGYNLGFSRNGPDFNPGLGFTPRQNYTRYGGNVNYGWFSDEASTFQNHQVGFGGNIFFNNLGDFLETVSIGPEWSTNWKSGSNLQFEAAYNFEDIRQPFTLFDDIGLSEGEYQFYTAGISFNTPEAALFSASLSVLGGQFFDGYRLSGSLSSTLTFSRHFNLQPFYQINRVTFPDRNEAFTAHLARVQAEYYLNRHLSASTFIQFSNAADLVVSNVRLRYHWREGNDLFIVYNENLNTSRFDQRPVQPLSQNRAVMLKYTYTFNAGI